MNNKRVNNAFFLNRKGQEGMSVTTIIGLVLGVLILIVLVLGFSIGWDKVFPFLFSSNNVGSVKTNCAAACATGDEYSYCSQPRTLKAEDLPSGADGKVPKEKEESCNFFATDSDYLKYGIEACSAIDCP